MSEANTAAPSGVAEQITALAAQMKNKIDDVHKLANDGKQASGEAKQEVANMVAAMSKLQASVNDVNTRLDAAAVNGSGIEGRDAKIVNECPRLMGKALNAEQVRDYDKAFSYYLRKTDANAPTHILNAMSVGVDPDGGYLVSPTLASRIIMRRFDFSPIRSIANVVTITSDSLKGVVEYGEAGSGWVSETETRSETDTPELKVHEIPAEEIYAYPKITQRLIDDAGVDVESWLVAKIGERFARREGQAFVAGTGAKQPRGFTTYTTAATADSSRTWGQLEHVITGVAGDLKANTPFDTFIDVIGAMRPEYLPGCRFVMSRSVLAHVRKEVDANYQYFMSPSVGNSFAQTLFGFPITVADDMPAKADDALAIAFGNFNEGYQIVDRAGVRLLRDPFSNKPYVGFYATARVGGGVVNYDAIKFIKFAD